MSKVQVDTIDTRSGTSTMQIGSTNTSTINIGVSGDTVNIPAGVTIANAGTATGFGGGDNTPSFFAYASSDQDISDDTATKVTLGTESFDTDNAFASSKFTVPSGEGGKYFFTYSVGALALANSNMDYTYVYLYKNGSNFVEQALDLRSNPARSVTVKGSVILDLSASDYIELYVNINDNSGSPRINGSGVIVTYLGGYKLIGV